MNHPLSDMMTSTMAKIKDMIDVNTVIGDPIIPVTKVSIGYGSGGSDFAMSSKQPDNCFGGGAGGSVKITPIAFLIIRDGNVRMLPVAEPASTSMDRLIEQVPDLLDRIDAWRAEKKTPQPLFWKFVCNAPRLIQNSDMALSQNLAHIPHRSTRHTVRG